MLVCDVSYPILVTLISSLGALSLFISKVLYLKCIIILQPHNIPTLTIFVHNSYCTRPEIGELLLFIVTFCAMC